MADKKVEKALYGPSTLEVALGALLGLVAGVATACVYLVAKPTVTVSELPKEPAKGVVYYIAGTADSSKARGWEAKLATFVAGGTVAATEDELNAWAASLKQPPAPAAKEEGKTPAPTAAKKSEPAANEFLSSSGLNFRVAQGEVQIAQKVLFNYFGLQKELLLQARGGFERSGDGYVFHPRQVYLGSCPIHALPGVAGALGRALVAKHPLSDDFRAAWAKVSAIAVQDRQLQVTTQP